MRDTAWGFNRTGIVLGGLIAIIVGGLIGWGLKSQNPRVIGAVAGIGGFGVGGVVLIAVREWRRSRIPGYIPRFSIHIDGGNLIRGPVIGLVVLLLGLAAFHAVVTGSLGAGLRMTTEDLRVAVKCPQKHQDHTFLCWPNEY